MHVRFSALNFDERIKYLNALADETSQSKFSPVQHLIMLIMEEAARGQRSSWYDERKLHLLDRLFLHIHMPPLLYSQYVMNEIHDSQVNMTDVRAEAIRLREIMLSPHVDQIRQVFLGFIALGLASMVLRSDMKIFLLAALGLGLSRKIAELRLDRALMLQLNTHTQGGNITVLNDGLDDGMFRLIQVAKRAGNASLRLFESSVARLEQVTPAAPRIEEVREEQPLIRQSP